MYEVTRHESVAVLQFTNAGGMNSFDPAILKQVRAAMNELLADDSVRAIVLTGTGKVFSTGANVKDMQQAASNGTATQWILGATEELHPLLVAMHQSHKPIIAAMNGVAAGGGLGLALACDARIGNPQARFAAGYFGIGLSPDGGATWLMPRLIGVQRTKRFFFDNEIMDAHTARELGLLDELIDDEALLPSAIALATKWGSYAKHSRESTKRLLETTFHNSFTGQMDMERGLIAAAGSTKDFLEGTTAFAEKREAKFQ